MRETTFIRQKKESWKKFEEMQKRDNVNPDELTKLFVEITDDLSYSRTFYSKRSVRVYLNYLSQLVFLKINKNKKVRISKFVKFWTHGLPMEMARSWRAMLLALGIFFGALMVGIVSTSNDIDYATQIMGPRYIQMTDENIKNGDPMAVYHQGENSAWSSFMLTRHNTQISAMTYTSGVLGGIPSIIIMIKNGIMLGTFHYYLYHKGVLEESMWVIWIHGVLEISSIIIAGGAGLVLGGGLLFPGTYTRLQSLRISAKRSFKIALSCIFILIISGFIEGSITRYTDMTMFLKYLLVLGSLAFIGFYFVAYPIYLFKTKISKGKFIFNDDIPHVDFKRLQLEKVREVGEMFNDTLNLFRQIFGKVFKGWLLLSFPILISALGYHFFYATDFDEELFWWISIGEFLYPDEENLVNFGFFIGLVYSLFITVYYALYCYRNEKDFKIFNFYGYAIKGLLKTWPLLLIASGIYFAWHPIWIFVWIVFIPFTYLFTYLGFYDQGKYGELFKGGSKLIFKSWFGSIAFYLLQLVIPLILFVAMYFLFGSKGLGIFDFIIEFILEHVDPFTDDLAPIANSINFVLYYFIFSMIIFFGIIGLVIQFHSVRERIQALTLYNRLKDFGNKHSLFEQLDEGDY